MQFDIAYLLFAIFIAISALVVVLMVSSDTKHGKHLPR
jgi:hypothetical protein